MARITFEEQSRILTDLIEQNGGEMSQDDIRTQLESTNQTSFLSILPSMAALGIVNSVVRARTGARAQLLYSLPNYTQPSVTRTRRQATEAGGDD